MIFKIYFCQFLLIALSFIVLDMRLVIRRVLKRKIKDHRKGGGFCFRFVCVHVCGFLEIYSILRKTQDVYK